MTARCRQRVHRDLDLRRITSGRGKPAPVPSSVSVSALQDKFEHQLHFDEEFCANDQPNLAVADPLLQVGGKRAFDPAGHAEARSAPRAGRSHDGC